MIAKDIPLPQATLAVGVPASVPVKANRTRTNESRNLLR